MERNTVSMERMTTKANSFIRIMTVRLCADGTTTTRVTFRRGLPRKTGCPLDWKSSLHGAARSRQGFRNESSRVPKISSGGYLYRLLIARTC
jgi:hypothetical protein